MKCYLSRWTSHNPYFNRWFSAIRHGKIKGDNIIGHNPYFNRWFSAISKKYNFYDDVLKSQSLF